MADRFPRIQARTPLGAVNKSTLDKLVNDKQSATGNNPKQHYIVTDPLGMNQISRQAAQDAIDADAIMQVLPDMEHVVQILVGTVLNPKDMSQADLNIAIDDNSFNSELNRPLLEVVSDYFKKDYKMDERLDKDLEDIIARQGASIKAVLPENALDMIINGERNISVEDFDRVVARFEQGRPLGLLGPGNLPKGVKLQENVSIEHLDPSLLKSVQTVGFSESQLVVGDNFSVLKGPELRKRRQKLAVSRMIKREVTSLEDNLNYQQGLTPDQINQLYQRNEQRYQQTIVVERPEFMERPSSGHPLVIDLPTSACIPVYMPGKPHEHVGYFVLLDRYGRPLQHDHTTDYYSEMRTDFSKKYGSHDNSSELLRITREALGAGDTHNSFEMEKIHQSYNSIIEADLKKRLINGTYREEFDIGFTDEVRRIMFTRHLKNQQTQMLFIPAELMVYIAFYHDKNGIGQSMLARSKILANMRSVLLFADTMGGVRNAVGRKKVNINLDPNDPDKPATISDIQQLILESGRRGFPIGAPDPGMTLDYLNRAGYDFSINANSDDFHQMSVEYDDYNTNIQAGNPDLQDRLKKMHYSAMSCPPEKVDPDNGSEFAVSIVQNDLLMARRVKTMQKVFTDGQTKFVRIYTTNSSILVNQLLEVVKNNPNAVPAEYANRPGIELVEDFINSLVVRLPQPDSTRVEEMLKLLENYSALLDKVLEAYITQDLFQDELMAKGGSVEKAIAVIKAHFMRLYIHDNNILPEVGVLYEMQEGKPVFNLFDNQKVAFDSLGTVIQQYITELEKTKAEWSKQFPETETDTFGGGDDGFGGSEPELDNNDLFAEEEEPVEPVEESEAEVTEETPEESEEPTDESEESEAEEEDETPEETVEEEDESPTDEEEPK